MDRLRRSNLVGDGSFARTWVENRTEFRPRSRRALSYELRQKGIDSETIQETLQDLDDSELALQAALKQAWKYRSLEWADFRLKMLAFLARRGFSYHTAAEATRLAWEVENDRQAEPVDPLDHDSPDIHSSDEEVDL
jgi:regulatory protein